MDGSSAKESRRLSGARHRVPTGDGGPRQIRQAVPALRQARPTHPLRGQRNELLPDVSDGGEAPRRPIAVAADEGRLAEIARGAGGGGGSLPDRYSACEAPCEEESSEETGGLIRVTGVRFPVPGPDERARASLLDREPETGNRIPGPSSPSGSWLPLSGVKRRGPRVLLRHPRRLRRHVVRRRDARGLGMGRDSRDRGRGSLRGRLRGFPLWNRIDRRAARRDAREHGGERLRVGGEGALVDHRRARCVRDLVRARPAGVGIRRSSGSRRNRSSRSAVASGPISRSGRASSDRSA